MASTSFGASEFAIPQVELPAVMQMSRLGLARARLGFNEAFTLGQTKREKSDHEYGKREQLFLKSYERGITFLI